MEGLWLTVASPRALTYEAKWLRHRLISDRNSRSQQNEPTHDQCTALKHKHGYNGVGILAGFELFGSQGQMANISYKKCTKWGRGGRHYRHY